MDADILSAFTSVSQSDDGESTNVDGFRSSKNVWASPGEKSKKEKQSYYYYIGFYRIYYHLVELSCPENPPV